MSRLRFVFGPPVSGKSTKIYREILKRAEENPERNFIVIVPDQNTLMTQKRLVELSPRGGILNVDVLSFGRLTHRILQEVGREQVPVLDDTGKSLVLQKIAAQIADDLPVLGSRMHKQGYIHEVKSVISEFMQYGLSTDDVDRIVDETSQRGMLQGKLRDINTLYKAFNNYISGNFITKEEKLDILRKSLWDSRILPDSVIVFDGFTGFTPIQERVIGDLLKLASELIVTLVMGEGEEVYSVKNEQDLFLLTKEAAIRLKRIAPKECEISEEYIACASVDSNQKKPIVAEVTSAIKGDVRLMKMTNPANEASHVCLEICRLIQENGYKYGEIAVVCSQMDRYADYMRREARNLGIPIYVDQTMGIRLNPIVEAISSSLQLYMKNFSKEAVFHYLRSGLSGFTSEEVDTLQDYVSETGIRGINRWTEPFSRKTRYMDDNDETELEVLNLLRSRFMENVLILKSPAEDTAGNFVKRLYDFLVAVNAQAQLETYKDYFEAEGDVEKSSEYEQIYGYVIELLDSINELIGNEKITIKDFVEILEAGFGELRVGFIPAKSDRVVVGDITRSRLGNIKVLFLMGANDGCIPAAGGSGGILSEMDREYLLENGVEIAPTSKQDMYAQRLYLYMLLGKPNEKLYLSYSGVDETGKSMRESYLVGLIKKKYSNLQCEYPERMPVLSKIVTTKNGKRYLAEGLNALVDKGETDDNLEETLELYRIFDDKDKEILENAAFMQYEPKQLSEEAVKAMYDGKLIGSVSQLEGYALCAYRYFLQYGLSLKNKEEYELNNSAAGTICHNVIKGFDKALKDKGYKWNNYPPSFATQMVDELILKEATSYQSGVYYDTERNQYNLENLKRVLIRSLGAMQHHAKKGSFADYGSEVEFWSERQLKDGKKLVLRGMIDRVDIAEDNECIYVKITDYKSSVKDIELDRLILGLQLQLPLYMSQEVKKLSKGKPVKPGAMLYFHLDNPMLDSADYSDEEKQEKLLNAFKTKGLVLEEDRLLGLLDDSLAGREPSSSSNVVPVAITAKGEISKTSKTVSYEDMENILLYAEHIADSKAEEILSGSIEINPIEDESCKYCNFRTVCKYDEAVKGYSMRTIDGNNEDSLECIRAAVKTESEKKE